MLEINLFDSNFVGQDCSVATQTPRLMRYVRGQMRWSGITVFTDNFMYSTLVDDVDSRFKIGWLHEGRCLHPENYDRIGLVKHKFDRIMTHDAALLSADPLTFMKTIRGGSWVAADQWDMYPKSKNVSMILSEKRQTEGHKLRHAIVEAGLSIDLYGPQYTPIGYDKSIAYKDYRFAVVVEACRENNFFSEHLIDALAYGCAVFYWGCPNIGQWFHGYKFYPFRNATELSNMLSFASVNTPYVDTTIREMQQTAHDYAITEDWQIQNCLRPFMEAL